MDDVAIGIDGLQYYYCRGDDGSGNVDITTLRKSKPFDFEL